MSAEEEFSLGSNEDNFSLGNNESSFSLGDKESNDSFNSENLNSDSKINGRLNIDDFYNRMLKDWEKSSIRDYKLFLQQGHIPAKILYEVLGLSPYSVPTDEDIERIKDWGQQWQKEASKFQRIDTEKSEHIVEAVGKLVGIFSQPKQVVIFNETLKDCAWRSLSQLIAYKCSDKIVELYEMSEIYQNARDSGLMEESLEKDTVNRINKEIKDTNSVIEDLGQAFKTRYENYIHQSPTNIIDNQFNRNNLFLIYKQLKESDNMIKGLYERNNDKCFMEDFTDFMKTSGISLKSCMDCFIDDCFNNFKQSHDISKPLTLEDFGYLKAFATGNYSFTEEQWEKFVSANNIQVEKSISKEELQKLEEEKAKMQAQLEEANNEQHQKELELQNKKLELQNKKLEIQKRKDEDKREKNIKKQKDAEYRKAKVKNTINSIQRTSNLTVLRILIVLISIGLIVVERVTGSYGSVFFDVCVGLIAVSCFIPRSNNTMEGIMQVINISVLALAGIHSRVFFLISRTTLTFIIYLALILLCVIVLVKKIKENYIHGPIFFTSLLASILGCLSLYYNVSMAGYSSKPALVVIFIFTIAMIIGSIVITFAMDEDTLTICLGAVACCLIILFIFGNHRATPYSFVFYILIGILTILVSVISKTSIIGDIGIALAIGAGCGLVLTFILGCLFRFCNFLFG